MAYSLGAPTPPWGVALGQVSPSAPLHPTELSALGPGAGERQRWGTSQEQLAEVAAKGATVLTAKGPEGTAWAPAGRADPECGPA